MPNPSLLRVPLTVLVLGLVAPAVRGGEDTEKEEFPPIHESLLGGRAPFLVMAQVNHPNLDYREGDNFSVRVASEEEAFVYVLYQQADGKIYQIFPNKHQPNNRLAARQAVEIPASDDLFRWVVGSPFGKERVKVIASKSELDVLADPKFRTQRFSPVSVQSFKGIELELGDEEPAQWAETDVEIHTYPRGTPPTDRGTKRYGVFFGVSKHMFREEVMEATRDPEGGCWDPDLFACHRDAQKFGAVMHEIGRLNDFKVFTNDQATKANMQEAIAQWLPEVSRPGDTVFIFFSGHTGQIPDLDGEEPDGKDEYMVPHDFVDPGVLAILERKAQANELTYQPLLERVQKLSHLARSAGENAFVVLTHDTCITDDLLARWLQRLAGRQVILVMDSCHSAGYATKENEPQRARDLGPMNMLDRELQRLRDLGQPNQALLASALSDESAGEIIDKSMGNMTFFVVDAMNRAQGPVRLEEAFAYCKANMKGYFEALEKKLGKPVHAHQPFMVNYCKEPVYMKP
ncbi:MAG: DUF4384 domain-containing protein [Planctomycetota bacterium]